MSTAFEEKTTQAYQQVELETVKTEFPRYFEALEKHPRLLVGSEVPAIGKEGSEVLRSTEDAREWQDAVKHLLVGEVRDRASRKLDESRDFMATIHASIDLFKNNVDLMPGTKGFDVELANRFTTLAKPYEVRVDGKLNGYSIPVQPIINQIREELVASRAKQPAAPAAAAAQQGAAGAPPADPPQAGITSKAGDSGSAEDFSTLFGTIGLPNLTI